jgi:hypothetical protein
VGKVETETKTKRVLRITARPVLENRPFAGMKSRMSGA